MSVRLGDDLNNLRGENKMGEWFFTGFYGSDSKIENDQRLGIARLTHDCPFCGKCGSEKRSLAWIVDSCIKNAGAAFPCDSCGEYITFPSGVFKKGLFESLMKKDAGGAEYWSDSELTDRTPNDIFVEDWLQVLQTANKEGPVDLDNIEWDGKGPCPGCGKTGPESVSQSLECTSCFSGFSINQNDIDKTKETQVVCSNCDFKMIILPTVWCPKCEKNLRPGNIFMELFKRANQEAVAGAELDIESKETSTAGKKNKPSKSKKFLKAVGAVIFCFIGFLFFFGGANSIIANLSAHFVANYRIDFLNFFVALIFFVPGFFILRVCVKRNEKWRYPMGISSLLMSAMLIINYFSLTDFVARKKTGIEADVLIGVVNTYLVLGMIIGLTALLLIGMQVVRDKK
jgi:hypothetical protein